MQIKKYIPLAVKKRVRALETQVRTIGAKYRCAVCNSRVNAFQPLPEYYAENLQKHGWQFGDEDVETCNIYAYQCPYCQASDRDRLYSLYLIDYLLNLKSDGAIKILDFAPSAPLSGFIRNLIRNLRRDISYRTADLFANDVDDQVDITDLSPYKDNQFDFFICSHVLEHVPDDKKALRELFRILKPGGRGILMVPIILSIDEIDEDSDLLDEGERWRRFGQDDHVRLYSKKGFIERIRETGFIVHQHGMESFGEELLTRNGISNQSVLYVVEK